MPFTDSIKMVDVLVSDKALITATPADVVNGKVYIGTTLQLESGILPISEEHGDITLLAGESFNIPYGKNPVAYNVIAQNLASQTAATATAEEILLDRTAWVNGEKITGTMPNIGQESETIQAGATHTISKGYHDGTGVITARSLSDQTPGTAAADDILYGKIAWVAGTELTGSMPNNGKVDQALDCGQSYTIAKGYHDGTGVISANTLQVQTPGTATPDTILADETAWVDGKKIVGNIVRVPATTKVFTINEEYFIPEGWHTGNGKIVQNIPTYPGQTVASAYESQTLETAGHYVEGNIIVTGIDALNYKRSTSPVTDSKGNIVSEMDLEVTDNSASVVLSVDNWHDNATLNVYHVTFTDLIDKDGNNIDLDTIVYIDWKDQTTHTYTYGTVTISIGLESGTNAHTFTVNNITSGKISIVNPFMSRQFGDNHDKDE